MWDFKTLLPPKHWQQLKASVIAVLFKEKKKKKEGPLQSLAVGLCFSHRTAADSAGSALAAPSLSPAEPCWIWLSGWSAWTGMTWCCGSVRMHASGGSEICNAAGSSWTTRLPCWRSRGAWGPDRRQVAHWDPLLEHALQSLWQGWTHWAMAAERRQAREKDWNKTNWFTKFLYILYRRGSFYIRYN